MEAREHYKARADTFFKKANEPAAAAAPASSAKTFVEGSSRPSKRARVTPERIDWAEEVAAAEAAGHLSHDEEPAVSLFGSDDEGTRIDCESCCGEVPNVGDVDEDILKSIGYYADSDDPYVLYDGPHELQTNVSSTACNKYSRSSGSRVLLNMYNKFSFLNSVYTCEHNKSYNECRKCKGKRTVQKDDEATTPYDTWILDSGASYLVMCGQGLKPSSPPSPALRSPSLHKPEQGLERAQGRAWGQARPDQALQARALPLVVKL